jgi:aryl-alcohol dehydrogenase-like predicted oxidoreductase
MTQLGSTGFEVFPLCLGGNVFGWTADEPSSFAVLDAYREAGGNFIDTANGYSHWVPGHSGGESEVILGRWMKDRGVRDEIVLATKVGGPMPGLPDGLGAAMIRQGVTDSLARLQTDRIDLYYAHFDDESTSLEETVTAFGDLVREGIVRSLGFSNYSAERLAQALAIAERDGMAPIRVLQPHYNLVEREFEAELEPLAERHGLATVPYFALAKGFLAGKYRPGGSRGDSPRAEAAMEYLDARGALVLEALDALAIAHASSVAAVSLAWLLTKPTVVAPIASARTVEQLADLLPMTDLTLDPDEIARLDAAAA